MLENVPAPTPFDTSKQLPPFVTSTLWNHATSVSPSFLPVSEKKETLTTHFTDTYTCSHTYTHTHTHIESIEQTQSPPPNRKSNSMTRKEETVTTKEDVSSSSSSSSSSTTATSSTSTSTSSEPYKELKWGSSAPLFINDKLYDRENLQELQLQEKQILPLHAGRTALLVVDVQPEYWSQCPAVRKDFPDFPKHLERLVAQCRAQRAKIIWVRADYRYAHSPWLVQFARLHQGQIPTEVYSDPSQQDQVEWEDFATPLGGEYVIPKTSWSSTRHTALMDLLKQSGIDTVLVAGLITSVCVQHSAFGIFEAGYRTLLVTNACADRGKARHDAALALYGDYMYELLAVDDVCQPSSPYYLQPAKPVWLTPDSVNNLVQPQFCNSLQDSVVMEDNHIKTVSKKSPSTNDESRNNTDPTAREGETTLRTSTDTARTSTSSLSTLANLNPSLEVIEGPVNHDVPVAAIQVVRANTKYDR